MKPDPHGEAIIEEFLASQRDGDAYLRPHVRTTAYVGLAAIIARALLDAHQRGRRAGMEEAAKVAEIFHEDDDRMDRKIKSDVANAIRAKAQEVTE